MTTHRCTETAKLEREVLKAALRRYRAWKKEHPETWREVLQGNDSAHSGGKIGGNMIRACARLAGDYL